MQRKITAAILALLMVLTMAIPAFAVPSSTEYTKRANTLYTLGLFKGVSTTTVDFALENVPNRNEALVMLIRLLGKESAAQTGSWKHPFTDVADWMQKYVGYAYENGLTKGISATEFGGTNTVKVQDYLTFVLRSLGYNDTESATTATDFTWTDPYTLSELVGLTDGYYSKNTLTFLRRDVVYISYNALAALVKGSNNTLLNKLVNKDKAVDSKKVSAAGLSKLTETVSETLVFDSEYKSLVKGNTFTLKATIYPSYTAAATIKFTTSNKDVATVSSSGKVTGIAAGVATIYANATDGGSYAYCVVKVTDNSATTDTNDVEFAYNKAYLRSGESAYFPVESYPAGADANIFYVSSDTSVATVDSTTGKVTAKAVSSAKAIKIYVRRTSSSSTNLATLNLTVYPEASGNIYLNERTDLTNLTLASSVATITAGAAATKINLTTAPVDADRTDLTWTSSNTSVATVTDGGYVKGISAGTATIKVEGTTAAGKAVSDTVSVTVIGNATTATTLKEVIFRFANYNIASGASMTPVKLTTTNAAYSSTNSQYYQALPLNASSNSLYWVSDNINAVTVNAGTGALTAGVVAVQTTATITVYASTSNLVKLGSYQVTVYPATQYGIANTITDVSSLSQGVYTMTVATGETAKLSYYAFPANGDQTRISWTSNDATVATVSAGGYVTGVKAGTATVTARLINNLTYTFTVTVSGTTASTSSMDIKGSYFYLQQGISYAFYLPYTYPSTSNADNIVWTSSNTSYLTVEKGGKINVPSTYALSTTTAYTVTARDSLTGASDSCTIYVVPAALVNSRTATSCTLSQNSVSLSVGSSVIVPVSATNPTGLGQTINWVSQNSDIAYVDNQYIKGIAAGSTTVYGYSASGAIIATFTAVVTTGDAYYTSLTYTTTPLTTMSAGITSAQIPFTLAPLNAQSKVVRWNSTSSAVATVNPSVSGTYITVTSVAAGTTQIYATNGAGIEITGSRFSLTVTQPSTFTKATMSLVSSPVYVDQEVVVKYEGSPSKVQYTYVTAKSSDESILVISSNPADGSLKIKGVKAGTATIMMYNLNNEKIGELSVKVDAATEFAQVVFEEQAYTFPMKAADDTSTNTGEIKFSTVPVSLSSGTIRFTSDNTSIITNLVVNDKNTVSFTILKKATGSTPVTLTAWNSLNKAIGSIKVYVVAPTVNEVNVIPENSNPMYVGLTKKFNASVTPSNGDTTGFEWSSSNSSVATVDKVTGLVTAVGAGTTEIYYGKVGVGGSSYTLTVSYDTIESIDFKEDSKTELNNKNAETYSVNIKAANGGKIDPSIYTMIKVESSDTSVLTVTSAGLSSDTKIISFSATAIKSGVATITVTVPTYSGTTTATLDVTVNLP